MCFVVGSDGLVLVNEADLRAGLSKVKPSALREVAVEVCGQLHWIHLHIGSPPGCSNVPMPPLLQVPRVHWTDIGGQHQVKQAIRETVEWPLVHPEAFLRMGISPPKGVSGFESSKGSYLVPLIKLNEWHTC